MAKVADIGTYIVRTPKIRGGRPHIAGTGVTVRRIVGWYKLGLSPEGIADRIGHLSLAQVYTALRVRGVDVRRPWRPAGHRPNTQHLATGS